jgi:hypothetical protein
MLRRLGRQFRQLISHREQNLDHEILQRLQDPAPYKLEEEQFYLQLAPLSAEIEDAKLSAKGGMFEEASLSLYDHLTHRIRPHKFVQGEQLDATIAFLKGHADDCKVWLSLADNALKRRFQILADEPYVFTSTIDWFSDLQGKSWPFGHVSELEARFQYEASQGEGGAGRSGFAKADPPGPIERTFVLNQLSHLADLARGYWISGNEAYISELIVQMVDWADRNPPMMGVSWLHPRTIAHRTRNLLVISLLALESPQFRNENTSKLFKLLLLHAAYLAALLAKGCRDQLAVAASLYLVAAHFPEFNASRRWSVMAQRALEEGQAREFYKDGLHRSGSSSAHREATEWLLLVCLVDQMNSRSWAPLNDCLETSLEALLYLRNPNHSGNEFGPVMLDGHLGRGFGVHEHVRRILMLGATVLQRADFLHGLGETASELIWWGGPATIDRLSHLGRREPTGVRRLFAESNLAVCRDQWAPRANWCRLIGTRSHDLDKYIAPPPASLPYHDDALTFSMVADGEPVFLDPGGPAGFEGWSEVFSRASMHTGARIGREIEPYDTTPASQPNSHPVTLESVKDGYLIRASRPVWLSREGSHSLRRELLFLPKRKRMVVRDTFVMDPNVNDLGPEGDVHFESNLVLAPQLDVLMRGDMGCLLRGKKLQARIIPLFPARFRYELLKGKQEPMAGWWWHESNRAAATNYLRYFARLKPPFSIVLWIAWNPEDTLTPRAQDVDKLFSGSF